MNKTWKNVVLKDGLYRLSPKIQTRISRIESFIRLNTFRSSIFTFYFQYVDLPFFLLFERLRYIVANTIYILKGFCITSVEVHINDKSSFDDVLFLLTLQANKKGNFKTNISIKLPPHFLLKKSYIELLAFQWLENKMDVFTDNLLHSGKFTKYTKPLYDALIRVPPKTTNKTIPNLPRLPVRASKYFLDLALSLKASLVEKQQKLVLINIDDLSHLSCIEANILKNVVEHYQMSAFAFQLMSSKDQENLTIPKWLNHATLIDDTNWSVELRIAYHEVADCNILTGADLETLALLNRNTRCLIIGRKLLRDTVDSQVSSNKLLVQLSTATRVIEAKTITEIIDFCNQKT